MLVFVSFGLFDYIYVEPNIPIGSLYTTIIYVLSLTTGLGATFMERICTVLILLGIVIVKALLVGFGARGAIGTVVYILPILMSFILVMDLLISGDRDRRIR